MDKQQDKDNKQLLIEAQKEFHKELAKLIKPLSTLVEAKPGDANFPELTVKAFTTINQGTELTSAIASLGGRFLPLFEEAMAAHTQSFKRHESAYLRGVRERGIFFRETSQGWRVGPLQLETKPTLTQIRILYNREPLTGWITVVGEDSFIQLEREANNLLQLVQLSDEQLFDWMWVSFKKATVERYEHWEGNRCLIQDMAEEFGAKARKDSVWRKKLGGLAKDRYPLWAFLYNLDRYRLLGAKVPAGRRLALQTGSQQEVSKGLGVTIGGLIPEEDYKIMCYLFPLGQ
jgi:hypothetical protein